MFDWKQENIEKTRKETGVLCSEGENVAPRNANIKLAPQDQTIKRKWRSILTAQLVDRIGFKTHKILDAKQAHWNGRRNKMSPASL